MAHSSKYLVLKFGGSSVSKMENWQTINRLIIDNINQGYKVVVVCSAIAGVTNFLQKIIANISEAKLAEVISFLKDKHISLSKQLNLSDDILEDTFKVLEKLLVGASLLGEVSPKVAAKILATGELLSTKIGFYYLKQQNINIAWYDARNCLLANDKNILNANCDYHKDEKLIKLFNAESAQAIITQGFIASDLNGHTVLLGRGGSDTSAAYFAAKLGAESCQIWTDVLGVYTANPRQINSARLLKNIDYDQAQELASTGAKVLHPRCILPLKKNKIPLQIKCTTLPKLTGTKIGCKHHDASAMVKAIVSKKNITLISIESVGMFHQSGYLAKLFNIFANHDLSIDLISTSQTNITVSLDPLQNSYNKKILKSLILQLKEIGHAEIIAPCASISLVGKNIRSILHQISPTLKLFEETKVHLLTQSANDMNLTIVVDEDKSDRLVAKLHSEIFDNIIDNNVFGNMWHGSSLDNNAHHKRWWYKKQNQLLRLCNQKTPQYVYDKDTVDAQAEKLLNLKSIDQIFYAIKANSNKDILQLIYNKGIGFECVSIYEVNYILQLFPGIDRKKILFTPNFAAKSEYIYALQKGVFLTVDNKYPLLNWPDIFADKEIILRFDPNIKAGHHKYVQTAGENSKFGISFIDDQEIRKIILNSKAKIIGLHAHSGSGIRKADNWLELAQYLKQFICWLPDVRVLNLGGGLHIPYKPHEKELDIAKFDQALLKFKDKNKKIDIWIEPGRYLVGQSGVLLACVTQVKQKGSNFFVGVDAGMNSLIRPSLYGAYHHIVNLSRLNEPVDINTQVVGPICESADFFGHNRSLPKSKEGDIILIDTVGAYGHSMASNYNMRPVAGEVFLHS